ncbi:hypothetical protein, Concanavalin A-like lectin/glucanases superfamily motives [Planktothrix serta PCC 8927]|uniref:LamG-like jellyroll fold domain-containing protein n=1 Tax=Planktothrix serta PCC 8927 TaxID=671068 RepID=A0A7Z9BEU8_9CYAN|nr:LamG-like jellyroll fold domain-containing protein [Planktothrix serta]VXD10616.1 hypothetical protein, Concanavalin A-like lectin/glucanases superfamily motives [Planktothrix serta PCC 8927]
MLESFIKTYAPESLDKNYKHTAMLSHGGVVVAFALDSSQQFWYTVLDLENNDIQSPLDVNYWFKEPVPINFPKEITQVGYSIAGNQTIPDPTEQLLTDGTKEVKPDKDKTLEERFLASTARLTADAPFQVMSDGQFVYLIRQAIEGNHPRNVKVGDVPIVNRTLLVDRFVFVGTELKPKLEVRYQRSRHKDRPLNRKDSLSSKDLENQPFYEPTQELDMVRNLTEGRFSVVLLPTAIPNIKRWQIFAHNSSTGLIDSFNIERSKDGLFNPRGTQFYTCSSHPEVFEYTPGKCPECSSDLIPKTTKEGFAESALVFNGTDTWVETRLNDLSGSALTIEYWFKGQSLQSAVRQQDGSNYIMAGWQGKHILSNDGGTDNGIAVGQLATDGNWHHIAMTWKQDSENGFISYLDGRVVAQRKSANTPLPKINAQVLLGAYYGQELTNGVIDEIRIWNRARSRGEIKADLNRRLVGNEDGLVAYWRLDEGCGNIVHDQTDNGFHGTIQGTSLWVNSDAPIGDNPGVTRSSFEIHQRTIAGGLSALLYYQQENIKSGYSNEPKPLKKSARMMLAAPTRQASEDKNCIAILDFAVSREGKLALIPDTVALPVLGNTGAACSINDALDRRSSLEVELGNLNRKINDLTNRIAQLNAQMLANQEDWVNLVAYFLFDEIKTEGSTRKILDRAGNNHGIVMGASLEKDLTLPISGLDILERPANCIRFDGVDDYIQLSQPLPIFSSSFTVSMWLKVPLNSDRGILLGDYQIPSGLNINFEVRHGLLRLYWGASPDLVGTRNIRDNQWHYISFVRDRESKKVYTYIDGVVDINYTGEIGNARAVIPHRIGRDSRQDITNFEGLMAELCIWKVARTPDEIRADMYQRHGDAAQASLLKQLSECQQELNETQIQRAQKLTELAVVRDAQFGEVRVPMELLHIDRFGLTVTGGLLSFAYTNNSPTLFDSAIGKLGLYFVGAANDQFFAAYFDTLTERVVHRLPAEVGQLILIARNTDGAMDSTTITVENGSTDDTCQLTFSNDEIQLTETWPDLPRNVQTLAQILNGNALPPVIAPVSDSPTDGDAPPIPNTSIYYDYAQVILNPSDKSAAKGSLFFAVSMGNASGVIQNTETPINLGEMKTRVNEWVADSQGNALYFDGQTTLASKTSTTELERFDAPSNVTVETWAKPETVSNNQSVRLINHHSPRSRYFLGLKGVSPGSALVFNGQDTSVETGLTDLSGSALTIEYWFKGKTLQSAVRQQEGTNLIASGANCSQPIEPANQTNCLQFDGVNDYIQLSKPLSIFSSSFTVSLWLKVPLNSDRAILLGDYQIPNGLNINFEVRDGLLRLYWGANPDLVGTRNIRDNQWHYISFVRDRANNKVYTYIDGVIDINYSGAIADRQAVIAHRIGRDSRQDITTFEGKMAELSIWNVARTQPEIQADMYKRFTGTETNLVAYWPLNAIQTEGSVLKVVDLVNNNFGTVLNGAIAVKDTLPTPPNLSKDAFHILSNDGGIPNSLAVKQKVIDGQWHHVAMTWQQNTVNGFVSYLDGEIVSQRNSSNTPLPKMNAKVLLGTAFGTTEFLEGALAEVRIWKVARTPTEIKNDMRRPIRRAEPGLVGCWSLMNGDLQDYSGNSYHGVLRGNSSSTDYPLEAAVLVAGVNEQLIQTENYFFIHEWTHLAGAFRQSFALQFDGKDDHLNAGTAEDLNLTQDLTIEAFLRVTELGQERGILTKGRLDDGGDQNVPYSLSVGPNGQLIFAFEKTDYTKEKCESDRFLATGQFYKIAVTRAQGTDKQENKVKKVIGGQEMEVTESVTVNQWQEIRFFINGQAAGMKRYEDITPGTTDQPLEIGKAYRDGGVATFFKGTISEVRLWNKARGISDLGKALKGSESGLAAWWRFEENAGNTAFDSKGSNHANRIGARWVKNPDPQGSSFTLYMNGVSQKTRVAEGVLKWGDQNFTLGGYRENNVQQHLFKGSLEETRIWKTTRTQEQIQDNLFRRVLGDRKDLLAYYQFDADAEDRLPDCSGRANHLIVTNADWQISNAPVSYETPQVRSALAGVRTTFQGQIHSRPAIQEYGDTQYNSDNELIGVMKRCYSYIKDGEWQLITGFKIGNIITEWIGQAQYDPQIVGFIEGAPPVPSENCTMDAQDDYAGGSLVEIVEADNVQYTLSASKEGTLDAAFKMAASVGGGTGTYTVIAPFGGGIAQEVTEIDFEAKLEGSMETSNGWSGESSVSSGKNVSKNTKVKALGCWESDHHVLNTAIGQRFVFNNTGFALVQSDTADIFALRMEHNNVLIAFRFQPNPDIPKDWNLIPFQMNPRYVCQGTLDGRVGMDDNGNVYDPNYKNARDYGEYSYFKPKEAYSLKNRIRQEEEELKTYYENFSTSPLDADRAGKGAAIGAGIGAIAGPLGAVAGAAVGGLIGGLTGDKRLPEKLAKRNLVNTYVWTAEGGFFAETTELTDSMSETVGGSFSLKGSATGGFGTDIEIFGVGVKLEMEAAIGGSLNLTKSKTRDSEKSFSLNVELEVPDNIQKYVDSKPIYDQNGKPVLQAGKVDAYRFMTFYLEPSVQNFDTFVNKVVDPIWLEESKHPNAAAIRNALKTQQKAKKDTEKSIPWRVMHRVTFVSRVLPEIPVDKTPQTPEETLKAADIDSNYELIKRLEPFVSDKLDDYVQFTDAVRNAIDAYIPELKPAKDYIVEYMCQYYQVFD